MGIAELRGEIMQCLAEKVEVRRKETRDVNSLCDPVRCTVQEEKKKSTAT